MAKERKNEDKAEGKELIWIIPYRKQPSLCHLHRWFPAVEKMSRNVEVVLGIQELLFDVIKQIIDLLTCPAEDTAKEAQGERLKPFETVHHSQ